MYWACPFTNPFYCDLIRQLCFIFFIHSQLYYSQFFFWSIDHETIWENLQPVLFKNRIPYSLSRTIADINTPKMCAPKGDRRQSLAVNFFFTIETHPVNRMTALEWSNAIVHDVQHSTTGSRSSQDRLDWPNLGYPAIRLSVPLAIPFLLLRSSSFVHSSVCSRHLDSSHIYPSLDTREEEL